MKKGLIMVFVIFLPVLLVSPVFSQSMKAPVPVGNPIKIGGSLPLTGMHSETAKWMKNGYDFWADNVNKKGGLLGRPVKLTIYDDEGNPDGAVSYYERAITVDKVDLIFGGTPGGSVAVLMPLAEKYGKVFVGMGGHMKSFEQGYTYSFGSPPLMSDWIYWSLAGVIDDLIPKAEWPKSIAVFSTNTVMGLAGRGNIVKAMEERGIKVLVDETYNLPLADATPMVSKAKARGADVLCCLSFFDDGVMIMRAAKSIKYNPKLIFQQHAAIFPAWMKELGEDGNYVVNSTFWHDRLPFPWNEEINEGAKALFGMQAPLFFGFAYSWMKTLELAVEGAGTLDQKKVRDYLRSNKFDLPYGKGITFDSKGLPPPFAFSTQTVKGNVELIWPKAVSTTKFVYPRPAWGK